MKNPKDLPEEEIAGHLASLLKELKKHGHKKYGPNPHPVSCPTCALVYDGIPAMLGANNTLFRCQCGKTEFAEDGTMQVECSDCHGTLGHGIELRPGDVLPIGPECPICKVNYDYQTEISQKGGAKVRCLGCHTIGVLPADHPVVKDFRKKRKVGRGRTVGFTLDPNQCPRCLQYGKHRTFTEEELGAIELNETNYEVASVEPTAAEKRKQKAPKKNKKGPNIPKGFHVAHGSEMAH